MLFQFESVTKTYGSIVALDNLSVSAPTGAIGLLGPNGSGKTTLIRSLLGLTRVDRGSGQVLGMDFRRRQLDILALARAEYSLVNTVLPTFTSLRVTADPALATGLWIGIAGVALIVLVTLPWALESRSDSRRRRNEARSRYATRSRGAKVARRRGAVR